MAKFLQAFRAYGPRIDLNPTAQLDTVAAWMTARTGLNEGEILMVLHEISEAIVYFNRRGTPVKLEAVGTFTPTVDRHGTFRVRFRADSQLKRRLNAPDAFDGVLVNQDHIDLDDADYKALWDAEHPDDPLEL
jgi:hypothetical protein